MRTPIGIAGVIAALSVASDLARGRPPGQAMRACLLATELARLAGLTPSDRCIVYYATLLRYAGCAATSHEAAAALGDDIAVRAHGDVIDVSRPEEVLALLGALGVDAGRLELLGGPTGLERMHTESARADCEVGAAITRRLGLPSEVALSVLDAFERYDGRGAPSGKAGSEIAQAARFAAVAYVAVMFEAIGGADLAGDTVTRWSGRALDPAVTVIFDGARSELLQLCDPEELWSAVVAAEPAPRRTFRDEEALDAALAGFGDAADLKSVWFHGHARGVAALARTAASELTDVDARTVFRAGLVHDLGRVAVSTGIWERPGPLRPRERELVRLHPYHSGRILASSPALAPLGVIASRHHERVDGSGYPAGIRGSELDPTARLLAAADTFYTLGEPRPHRPPLDSASAARALSGLPLDRDAIRAVLEASHIPRPPLPALPVGLTERELAVLRLLAAGRTKREVAAQLFVSPSTVHTHTVHVYAKCGISTRAGLAMFAMQHGLVATPLEKPGPQRRP